MPKITQHNQIDITPEKFLNACTPEELIEVDLLLSSAYYQNKIQSHNSDKLKLP